ncbi:MAG: hypothetical protein ACR2MB_01340 [Acidimicrobiales bacterium]
MADEAVGALSRTAADGRWAGWGTQYAIARWGKLAEDHIANDTQAVAEYLERVDS